jgi:hypothetical protein
MKDWEGNPQKDVVYFISNERSGNPQQTRLTTIQMVVPARVVEVLVEAKRNLSLGKRRGKSSRIRCQISSDTTHRTKLRLSLVISIHDNMKNVTMKY